jgi:diguanylate cyclase (GGDEF)-like protein/PAS domain S-box-containing protein
MNLRRLATGRGAQRVRLPARLAWLLAAVILLELLFSAYLADQAWMRVEDEINRSASNGAVVLADNFERTTDRANFALDAIVATAAFDNSGIPPNDSLRQSLVPVADEVGAFILADQQGRVIASTDPDYVFGSDLSGLDAFQSAERHQAVAFGHPITARGESWLPMVRPYRQADSQHRVAIAMLRTAYLDSLFNKFRAGGANPLMPNVGPMGGDGLFELGGPELVRLPAPSPGADTMKAGQMLTQMLGDAAATSFTQRSLLDGVNRVTVLMRAGSSPFGVVVAVPVTMVWRGWLLQVVWILLGSGLLLAMLVMLYRSLATELGRRQLAEARAAAAIEEARNYAGQCTLLADYSSDVILQIGFDGTCRYVSPSITDMLGWSVAELTGQSIKHLIHPDDAARFHEEVEFLLIGCGPIRSQFRHLHRDGHYVWLEASLKLVNQDGTPDSFVANMRDITERIETESRLAAAALDMSRLASTDQLTGLTNRRYFNQELEREWRRAAREEAPISLLLLDVDFFKGYNDFYGHQGGDEVLKSVAAALTGGLRRPGDVVARWGGEEFVVLLPLTDLAGAIMVAENLRAAVEALAIPHTHSECGRLTISIGVATAYPSRSQAPEPLIAEADANLYEAKNLGRNRVGAPPVSPVVWAGL